MRQTWMSKTTKIGLQQMFERFYLGFTVKFSKRLSVIIYLFKVNITNSRKKHKKNMFKVKNKNSC